MSRDVTTGSLLRSTVDVLPKVLLPAVVLSGVLMALAQLFVMFAWELLWEGMDVRSMALFQVVLSLSWIATFYLLQAAVTWMVVQRVAGERPGFLASLWRGAGLSVRNAIAAFGVTAATAVPFFAAQATGRAGGLWGFVAAAFLIAYLVLLCGWSAAMPAAVTERLGGLGAMRRSWRLTRGRKLTIFLCGILFYAMWIGTAAVFALVSRTPAWAPNWQNSLVHTLFAAALAVFAAVTYARLREEREGTDAEALAELFT